MKDEVIWVGDVGAVLDDGDAAFDGGDGGVVVADLGLGADGAIDAGAGGGVDDDPPRGPKVRAGAVDADDDVAVAAGAGDGELVAEAVADRQRRLGRGAARWIAQLQLQRVLRLKQRREPGRRRQRGRRRAGSG